MNEKKQYNCQKEKAIGNIKIIYWFVGNNMDIKN